MPVHDQIVSHHNLEFKKELAMATIDALYCEVDDFNQKFYPQWEQLQIESGEKKRRKQKLMTDSEIMTLIIHFHQSNQKDFKNYYLGYVHQYLRKEFPQRLSYTQFLAVMPSVLVPLCALFGTLKGKPTGIAFIDSTRIKVCHNIRIPRHKVFAGIAQRGKTSMGWFYGFKLHLIINHEGEILATKLTPGNVDDRAPVSDLITGLDGKLYGDKGYLSKALGEKCFDEGVELITNVRRNMKPKAIQLWDKIMLRKRYIIETINDQLKSITQIEHSRHRSVHGFMLNLMGSLIAYCCKESKPAIRLDDNDMKCLEIY